MYFITIDGPNSAGKSTVSSQVAEALNALGHKTLYTKQPTSDFPRQHEEDHRGSPLARLIVEDRTRHMSEVVWPALQREEVIVCDRYVDSSLVYRQLDGISFEDTWTDNKNFRIPDMSILLIAPAATLENRLRGRTTLSRFEREHSSTEELALYIHAHQFLVGKGYRSITVENPDGKISIAIADIVQRIVTLKTATR